MSRGMDWERAARLAARAKPVVRAPLPSTQKQRAMIRALRRERHLEGLGVDPLQMTREQASAEIKRLGRTGQA